MTASDNPVVIAYDGSSAARQAVSAAALLLSARHAVVVTVWEEALAFVPPPDGLVGITAVPLDPDVVRELEQDAEQHAERVAREGTALARSLGFEAEPVALADRGGVAQTILEASRDHDASAIIIGSSGLGGLLSRLEGSTLNSVLTHSSCPVLVVHDPAADRN